MRDEELIPVQRWPRPLRAGVFIAVALAATWFLLSAGPALAARAGEIGDDVSTVEQALRFLSMRDPSVRVALIGCGLLGAACGALGSFVVVRKMALFGDALSHAVLPGVVLGFLVVMRKDPLAIFAGAVVAGLAGAVMIRLIRDTTRLKEDAALGVVLGGFFAVGACLLGMVQRLPTAEKSGLNAYLFGQAAAIGGTSFWLIVAVTVATFALVAIFFRPLFCTSFDPGFARVSGMPTGVVHYIFLLFLAFVVVVAIQAVGVVLVSALLIIPAATAYLLVDRLAIMVILSSLLGAAAAAVGVFISAFGLPTGPFIVLTSAAIFGFVLVGAPRRGLVARWWRLRVQRARVMRENTLKAVFRLQEESARSISSPLPMAELNHLRREDAHATTREVDRLVRAGLAEWLGANDAVRLTPEGARRAEEVVRNHRLWELYLTNSVAIAPDHVHDNAEAIEHILSEEIVRRISERLDAPEVDPHGRAIPDPSHVPVPDGETSVPESLQGRRTP